MERVFGTHLDWAAESEGRMCLGISPETQELASDGAPRVAIRVVIVSRPKTQREWSPVWSVDVVTRSEQLVELTPDVCGRGGKLLLWAYVLPDGMLAVDAKMGLAQPATLDSSFSKVQQPGTPELVLATQTADTEYRVFETVAVLDDGRDRRT